MMLIFEFLLYKEWVESVGVWGYASLPFIYLYRNYLIIKIFLVVYSTIYNFLLQSYKIQKNFIKYGGSGRILCQLV
jgi:hypothetical protein